MSFSPLSPLHALNKAYRKIKPARQEFDGFREQLRILLAQIPIPEISENERQELTDLVEQRLESLDEAEQARLESEINQLVYGLYELSADEIAIVEGR